MTDEGTTKHSTMKAEKALFERACDPKQEPILTILRVHLLSEFYLERLIQVCLPRGDKALENGKFTYSQKIVLAASFDVLDDRIVQAIKGLNKVRNQCAHSMDKQMTTAEVETIGRPLGKKYTEYRKKHGHSVSDFLNMVLTHLCASLAANVTVVEDYKLTMASQQCIGGILSTLRPE